ncbi:MAG TPA: adenylate/guanylate cyclase domain-containing protein [Burkholderiaceae bacterium]|nr:adenylate/guanylate cyclase domain-containing protein [Burkholderiaceae bacterium]
MQRRLAAILSADAAGYSRLMSDDELATVRSISVCRKLVCDLIETHHGRTVDTPGDNILAEFGSALDAVEAACAMQTQLIACNAELPEHRRMGFRIGVNLGDVIVEDGRVYGDGVNIAARLEALAEVGGICVSGKVHDEVRGKLACAFEDIGAQTLHNIAAPVRAYRIAPAGAPPAAAPSAPAAVTAVRPSVMVLPFVNMSGVAEQEFFVDGLTEDILTELSRFRELFVISRNTSFKFKGQTVDVKSVARDLGVQYVLEGSVRRVGDRVRITAQLIDAEADRHVWAERYDRKLEDIFAIQDEMTSAIVAVLPGRVEAATADRAARKPTGSMAAYECLVTSKVLHHRSTRAENVEALRLVTRATELDPNYAHAHAWRGCIIGQAWTYNWCDDLAAAQVEIERELKLALALDDNDSDVHRILAAVYTLQNDFDKLLYHQRRALSLNPNDDLIVVQQGEILTWLGQPDEGVEWILKAMRLNPFHPDRFWSHLGRAHFVARRYAVAIDALLRIAVPNALQHALLAACFARLGDAAQARQHLDAALKQRPGMAVAGDIEPTLHYRHAADLEHHRESLLQAGFAA